MADNVKKNMNILDRFINFFSPKAGYNRLGWRLGLRNYDGADQGRLGRNWVPINATGEQTNQQSRDILRTRARDLERNADMAEGIISALIRNIVGTGMTLQAEPYDNKTGTFNEKLSKTFEKDFAKWCKARNCDISGEMSFAQMQEVAVRRLFVDGGILFIKNYTSGGIVPLCLQMREVDDIETSLTSFPKPGQKNRIINGIEVDEFNKPIAYWLKNISPDGYINFKPERIPADRVIYIRKKDRPSEIREISRLARTVNRCRDVNEFVEAISMKERILACLSVFITKPNPAGFGIGRTSTIVDPQTGNKETTLAPGLIQYLEPGSDVKVVTPNGQSTNSKEFIMSQQRLAGSGQGLSYETTSRDMSQVNYSSARQGLLEDQKTYKMWQNFFIERFHEEVYTSFIISGVLSGLYNIPDFWKNKESYLEHCWIPPGWSWIDPNKEIMAYQKALESNITTLQQICAERGDNWEDVIKQRAKEKLLEKQLLGGLINAGLPE